MLYQLTFPKNYVVGIMLNEKKVVSQAAPYLIKLGFLGKPFHWVEAFCQVRGIKLEFINEENNNELSRLHPTDDQRGTPNCDCY